MTVRYVTPRTDRHVGTPADALHLVQQLADPEHPDSLVAVFLDAGHAVVAALVIDALPVSESTVAVVRHLMDGLGEHPEPLRFDALVLGSRRAVLDPVELDADLDRWTELDGCCADSGFELVEWVVIAGDRVVLPRERLGCPSRWHADAPA